MKTGLAQLALATDGPEFAKIAETHRAETSKFTSDINEALYHTVDFSKLKPETLYAYRVGDGDNWSEWSQFRTTSKEDQTLTFLYFGDAQNELFSHWSRVVRTGFMLAPDLRFIVHAGDLVNRGNRDAEWGEWHRAAGWINGTVPILASPGNHEYVSESGTRQLTRHWNSQFALPKNGPEGLEESCYYVDVQGVRLISLNSNERHEQQAEWLEEVLSKNKSRWTIAFFHHPIYSSAKGRDNRRLRELWQPVFDRHRLDLVLQGHDHTYGRSNLLSGANARSDEGGTVYVVSVSGPKMYGIGDGEWMHRSGQNTQLFQVIRIEGNTLRFEARTPTGRLFDSFELQKRKGAPNRLINVEPIPKLHPATAGD